MSKQRLIEANKYKECLLSGYSAATTEDDDRAAAAYEDALGCLDTASTIDPETLPIVQELREKLSRYEQAEQEGRLVITPDKLYDLVYDEEAPEKSYITEYNTDGVAIKFAGDYISADELGKTVFLTREEAENALKERENDGL